MNRNLKLILAVFFVFVIMISAISIAHNLFGAAKIDVTQYKLYSLSDGTKSIIGKLNQPVTFKLYYAETAAMKGPDQIKSYNDYYHYVLALLEEYQRAGKGKIKLQVIDPRPFSDDEQEALKYNLKRFNITETEGFFFGLVATTEYGANKTIEFFAPDRQNFIEYDISYLLDTMIAKEKNKIGIISSLPVTGEEMDGYMAQMMRMQGRQPQPAWTFVQLLRERYDVEKLETELDEIGPDIDILMVVHPKELPDKTLFAIDQYVLKGGRTIVCVDPHCMADQPDQAARMQGQMPSQSSNLNKLLNAWGVNVDEKQLAGDMELAQSVPLRQNAAPEMLIGFLEMTQQAHCFNQDNVIASNLNQVRMLFPGVIEKLDAKAPADEEGDKKDEAAKPDQPPATDNTIIPLISTTDKGNSWSVSSPYELMMLDGSRLLKNFREGKAPVMLGCMITGKFKTAFPDGIQVEEAAADEDKSDADTEKSTDAAPKLKTVTGLTEAANECAVVVFADVDFISDMIAFQRSLFGTMIVGDNNALMTNSIENLVGSGDLIAIRSRGNFQRPFTVVEDIKKEADKKTLEKEEDIKKEIEGFQTELRDLISKKKQEGQMIIDASELADQQRKLQIKINEKQRELIEVQNQRREGIEQLGATVQKVNMLAAPSVILLIAISLGIHRAIQRRRYLGSRRD